MGRATDKSVQRHFGKAIRYLRQKKRISQEQLALLSELDRSYIGGVERGERNPSLIALTKIAGGLDLSLSEIFAEYHRTIARRSSRAPET